MTPCVRVKAGVEFEVIRPAGIRLLAAIDHAAQTLHRELTITCGTEKHGPENPHTLGEAYDLSLSALPVETIINLRSTLQDFLGSGFTVLLETPIPFTNPQLANIQTLNRKATGPHFHLQRKKGTFWPPPEARET